MKNNGIQIKWSSFGYCLAIILVFIILTLFLRLFFYLLDFEIPYFTNLRALSIWFIITGASVAVCAISIVIFDWLRCENSIKKKSAFSVMAISVALAIFGMGYFYSWHLYRYIPQGFGGGRPLTVDIWLGSGDGSHILKSITRNSECRAQKGGLLCKGVQLLYHDSEIVVVDFGLNGRKDVLIMDRGSVRAFAPNSPQ